MQQKRTPILLLVGLLAFGSLLAQNSAKPNIIFILADDLSYRDLSCYGQRQFKTPNIDRLAQQGVRFIQAYSAAPECAPARSSLLTGLHTGHGPIRANLSARGQDHLQEEDLTIAEVLKSAGYTTGFTGKWGLGLPGTPGVPYLQGFDFSFGFYDQQHAQTYFPDYLWKNDEKIEYPENSGFDMARRFRAQDLEYPDSLRNTYDGAGRLMVKEVADSRRMVYSEREIENAALQFVRDHAGEPFFLYIAPQTPHGPVIVDELGEMARRTDLPQPQREWAAMVQRLDLFVGNLTGLLQSMGLYDNTVIFFGADNGYAMPGYFGRGNAPKWPDDPHLRNKGPFTGGQYSIQEGGLRIPCFVHAPKRFEPAVVNTPVWLPDFFSTAAALAGAKVGREVDGLDLQPVLKGKPEGFPADRPLYFSRQREQAVRKGPWRAFRPFPDAPVELCIVEDDSYCLNNVADFYPQVVRELTTVMDNSHKSHEWYWNPWEKDVDFKKKRDKAKTAGQLMNSTYPNGLTKMPVE